MKKFVCLLAVGIFAAATAYEAAAFVRYEDKHPPKIREVRITGFIDYAPFGYTEQLVEAITSEQIMKVACEVLGRDHLSELVYR